MTALPMERCLPNLSVWWREMREEEPPEDLESRMRRQHAEHAKAMEKRAQAKDPGRDVRRVRSRDGRGLSNNLPPDPASYNLTQVLDQVKKLANKTPSQ